MNWRTTGFGVSETKGGFALLFGFFTVDTPLHRILSNSTWLFGAGGIGALIGLVQGIMVARALGVECYGVLAIITSFTGFMGQVFSSRSWEMGIKFLTEFRAQESETKALAVLKLGYLIDIATALLSFTIAWFLADWGSRVFIHDTQYAHAIRLYSFLLLLNINGGTVVVARVFNRYDLLAKLGVLQNVLHLILVVIALYVLHFGLIGLLVTYIAAGTFSLILGLLVFRHVLRSNFTTSFLNAPIRSLKRHSPEILSFLVSTNLTDLFKIVQRNGAALALGYFSSPVQAGYFKLAQSFANKLALIYNPVFHSSYPELSTLWAKRKAREIGFLLRKLTLMLAPLGLAAIAITVLAGTTVISCTVGDSYLPAARVLIVLAIAEAIAGSLIWLGPTLLAMGRPGWRTVAVGAGTSAMLLGLCGLVPKFGAVGAAASIILSHLAWAAVGGARLWQDLRMGARS